MKVDALRARKIDLTESLKTYRRQLAVQRRLLRRAGYRQRTRIMREIDRIGHTIDNLSDAIVDINAFLRVRGDKPSV